MKRKRTVRRKFARKVVPRVNSSVKNYVRNAIKSVGETKKYQFSYNALPIGNNAVNGAVILAPYQSISQGTGVTQRVGDEITWKSLTIRGFVDLPAASNYTVLRVMVLYIQYGQSFTTTTQVETELFDNGGLAPFSVCHLRENRAITVMKDFKIGMNPGGGSSFKRIALNRNISLRNKKTKFVAGSTTGDNGKVVLYLCGSSPTSTDCVFVGTIRFTYKDA